MICQEAMLGCPGLEITTWGLRVQNTSVWGVVWWEDFHEEEGEGLLPVLHLGSDWPSSPVDAHYKRQAHLLKGCLRHPVLRFTMDPPKEEITSTEVINGLMKGFIH